MLRSMTGFGRGEYSDGERRFIVEIKTVNHRYIDINVRMLRDLISLRKRFTNWLKSILPEEKLIYSLLHTISKHSKIRLSLMRI